MNAPLPAVQREAMNARERRQQRAAVARRIGAGAPGQAGSLDWDTLGQAPAWLALPDAELSAFQRAVGAVVHAAELRLWIDGASIAAVRSALGEPVWHRLLNAPSGPTAGIGMSAIGSRLDPDPNCIGENLARVGTSVLLAALPPGPLQDVARALFAPIPPAEIIAALAESTVARARALLDAAVAAP
jgi:hypothetical protein